MSFVATLDNRTPFAAMHCLLPDGQGGEAVLVGVPRMDVMLNLNAAFTFLYLAKTVKGCWYGSANFMARDSPRITMKAYRPIRISENTRPNSSAATE